MQLISEEYLKLVINDIATTLKLEEWEYSKQNFEDIAQNYFGVLIPINLSGKSNNGTVNIPLVLKLAPTDERYRVSGAVTNFFRKEIFVYSKVLPKYSELQRSFPISSQLVMPICYYVRNDNCKELIALQNMCVDKYKPFINSMFLDKDHITVALISLARFHALSYICKEADGNLYDEAKEFCVPLAEKTNKRFIDILVDRLTKALLKFDNTKYVPLLEALKHNCVSIIESTANSVKSVCLCHGDIWKENILFKYEGQKQNKKPVIPGVINKNKNVSVSVNFNDNLPTSACLIDYQTTRTCSPAFDVLYLIITSTTSSLRKKHFNALLNVYYQTLEHTLAFANLSSEEIYSKGMLDYDLKIVGPACLIVANTAIWLASGLQEEGHVRSKIVFTTETAKSEAVAQYKDVISGIINDLSDYNYLNNFE